MASHFKELGEGLTQASAGLVEASTALQQAAQALIHADAGLQRAVQAGLLAYDEQEDLRESMRRIEGLVMDLIRRQGGNGSEGQT